tara:strand:- start:351 stop:605 length:255 start_codon:yes stop_codon:yes gene_type:complete
MGFKRLLNTDLGVNIISIILGLGLASLFRKICKDKNCLVFNGPIISDIEGKIYKHGDKCYKYSSTTEPCDSTKRQVELMSNDEQ